MPTDNPARARSFSDAAPVYNRWAEPQRRAAERLAELLPERPAERVLDVGCGTGILTALLARRYPKARITGIDLAPEMVQICRQRWRGEARMKFEVADACAVIPGEPCDVIASNCCLQWVSDLAGTVAVLTSALRQGGTLAASVTLDDSLAELRDSHLAASGRELRRLGATESACRRAWETGGLRIAHIERQVTTARYANPWEALRSFKGSGSTFRHWRDYAPLSTGTMCTLAAAYADRHGTADGSVPVTYEVLHIIGEKR